MEDQGLYTIGTVAELIGEHPETLRVWEKNGLISPNRKSYQRKYSNTDLLRLQFIKFLLDKKGLNIAGAKQVISMYPCWYKKNCKGGAGKNSKIAVNEAKPCWKKEGSFCYMPTDKSEICGSCEMLKKCVECKGCK